MPYEGFKHYSIEMFPSFCHGSKRKNYEKFHDTESSCWRFPTPAVINFRFGCPKITKPLFQFHVWHQQRCKNSAPEKIGWSGLFSKTKTPRGWSVFLFVWGSFRRHQNLQNCWFVFVPFTWKLVIWIYYKMLYGFKSAGKLDDFWTYRL